MKYNDYELVQLAQENNEDAYDILYKKYIPLLVKKTEKYAKYFVKFNLTFDDVYSEVFYAFDNAIKTFNEEGSSFYTFLHLCIKRRIITYNRYLITEKNSCNVDAISMDCSYDDDRCLFDVIKSGEKTPEEEVIASEEFDNLFSLIIENLSCAEVEALTYKLDGFSINDISLAMNKNTKCVYSIFRRIKEKVRVII